MSHWYAWFPGDYLRDTQHLSMVEDAAYRRILDHYYMVGRIPSPTPSDAALAAASSAALLRICRAITSEEQDAVRKVAAEFFEVRDGYFYQEKVERGLANSRAITEKRKRAGQIGAARTNAKRASCTPASAAANAAASAPTIPHPHVNPPPTEGTIAPKGSDSIFGHGLHFLMARGVSERSARSFLGLMRKSHCDELVAEAIVKAESDDITDPVPWMRQYLEGRKQTTRRAPRAEDFAMRDYGQGGAL